MVGPLRGIAASDCASSYDRRTRDIDWGAALEASGVFRWVRRVEIPWTREVSVDAFVADYSSHSYVADLAPADQALVLGQLRDDLSERLPDGRRSVALRHAHVGGAPMSTPAKRGPGRRPGSADTRGEILDAARHEFAEKGYDGASVRGIARAASVDPALVHHFFGSKEQVFVAAMALPVDPGDLLPDVLAGDPAQLGERFARVFLGLWSDPEFREPMLGVAPLGDHERAGRSDAARVRRLRDARSVGAEPRRAPTSRCASPPRPRSWSASCCCATSSRSRRWSPRPTRRSSPLSRRPCSATSSPDRPSTSPPFTSRSCSNRHATL